MSLVAYDDSDSDGSDYSDEEAVVDRGVQKASPKEEAVESSSSSEDYPNLFAKLPPPKRSVSAPLDAALQDMVVEQGSKSKRARIVIPSLNDYGDDDDDDEEEERSAKKFRPSKTGSGLVGLLPAPKNATLGTTQLKPHVLTQNLKAADEKPTPAKEPVARHPFPVSVDQSSSVQKGGAWSDEDDEADDSPATFFSFDEPKVPQVNTAVPVSVTCETDATEQHVERNAKNLEEFTYPEQNFASVEADGGQEADAPVADRPVADGSRRGKIVFSEHDEPGTVPHDVMLDDGALVRLRGRRNEEITIIDVSAADQIGHSQLMVKGLTEQPTYSSPSAGNDFHTSQLHRRKHQITYLAQQAKEREQELKNMWAQNRLTRKQTQAKYGF